MAAIPAHQAAVAQDGSTPSRATGAVFIPFLDGNHAPTFVCSTQYGNVPVRGSCGITFVSPHYAISSSHCFANANAYDPANQTFTATTFDVTQANVDDFYFDAAMQGTFPNYTPILGHTMNQAEAASFARPRREKRRLSRRGSCRPPRRGPRHGADRRRGSAPCPHAARAA